MRCLRVCVTRDERLPPALGILSSDLVSFFAAFRHSLSLSRVRHPTERGCVPRDCERATDAESEGKESTTREWEEQRKKERGAERPDA